MNPFGTDIWKVQTTLQAQQIRPVWSETTLEFFKLQRKSLFHVQPLTWPNLGETLIAKGLLFATSKKNPTQLDSVISSTIPVIINTLFYPYQHASVWQLLEKNKVNFKTRWQTMSTLYHQGILFSGVEVQIACLAIQNLTTPKVQQLTKELISPFVPSKGPFDPSDLRREWEQNRSKFYQDLIRRLFYKIGMVTINAYVIKCLLYPLQTINLHIQGQGSNEENPSRFQGWNKAFQCAQWILETKGISGFYQGFTIHLGSIIPEAVVLLALYSAFSNVVNLFVDDEQEGDPNALGICQFVNENIL